MERDFQLSYAESKPRVLSWSVILNCIECSQFLKRPVFDKARTALLSCARQWARERPNKQLTEEKKMEKDKQCVKIWLTKQKKKERRNIKEVGGERGKRFAKCLKLNEWGGIKTDRQSKRR